MQRNRFRGLLSEEIIVKSRYPDISAPAVRYLGDRGGDDLTFDWACIDKPVTIANVPQCAERDQFILFAGTNLDSLNEFQAEVQLFVGPEKNAHTITGPRIVYIPCGLQYGPVEFRKVDSPIVWMNFFIAPRFSKGWKGGNFERYVAEPRVMSGVYEIKSFINGNPFREFSMPTHQMVVLGDDLGEEGANFCLFYYSIRGPHFLTEPTHVHEFDMWLINLGGNPLNVEEFDSEIEMWWGEENQRVVLNSTSVAHVPAGLLHRCILYNPVNKPFVHIHAYTAKYCEKSSIVDEPGAMKVAPGMRD